MIDMKWLCLSALVLGLLGLLVPQAHAGVGRDRATGQAIWDAAVNGRSTTIGGSNGSMRVIGPAGPATPGTAPGSAKISGGGTVPVADKRVPVNMSGEVAKDAIVGGVMGCLTGGAVGCVLGVATPLALAYVANSGVRKNPDTGDLERRDPSTPAFGDWRTEVNGQFTPWAMTKQDACTLASPMVDAYFKTIGYVSGRASFVSGERCEFYATGSDGVEGTNGHAPLYQYSGPGSPTWMPATPQEVRDALYKNDPAPGIVDELARHGNIVWTLGDPTRLVSGPASVTGPKETTTHPDGSTTERQSSTPLSYSGPTVTAGPTTTTTTKKDPQGNTTSTETTTTEPGTEPEAPPEPAPTDTELPPVPDLYTRKYPDGIVGIWNQKKEQLKNTELVQLATGLMPNVGSGGTCPSWPVNLNLATTWAYGTHDVAPPCWIWDVAKAILIFSALLLARSLIFGG